MQLSNCLTLQRTEDTYAKQNMERVSSNKMQIFDEKDKILLQYTKIFKNWEIYHVGTTEVSIFLCLS